MPFILSLTPHTSQRVCLPNTGAFSIALALVFVFKLTLAECIDWLDASIESPWNEMDAQFAAAGISYLKLLRSTLDARGFQTTKLVGGDVHSWVDPMCEAITNGSDPV